jgi:hypothetical protein
LKALLGLTAAALSAGCPPTSTPPNGVNPNEAADRQAISSVLGEPGVAPLFPSRLINDGVGIFSAGTEVLPSGFPRRWGRSYAFTVQAKETSIAEATSLSFVSATEATGLFKQDRAGKLVLDYTWQRNLLSKPFVESSQRKARFQKFAESWRLTDVNLVRIQPEGSAFKAGTFVLTVDGQPARRFQPNDWVAIDDLPRVKDDQLARLEVELTYEGATTDPAFYAFLSVPPMRDRLRLRDDGLGADRQARDGVYTAQFRFGGEPGLRHLVIDAIAGKTFADPAMTNYDGTQWGIPYRAEGGEGR